MEIAQNGSMNEYQTTVITKIGDKEALMTVEVVENDAGYGIYNFDVDFEA